MYKRVMVTYDEGIAAQRALDEAFKFADNKALVRIVHVIDMRVLTESAMEFADTSEIQESLRNTGNKILEHARKLAQIRGVRAETALLEGWDGKIADTIAKDAKTWQSEVIVMGIHVRHGLASLIHTNVAEEVLHNTLIPVLLVRDEPAQLP